MIWDNEQENGRTREYTKLSIWKLQIIQSRVCEMQCCGSCMFPKFTLINIYQGQHLCKALQLQ